MSQSEAGSAVLLDAIRLRTLLGVLRRLLMRRHFHLSAPPTVQISRLHNNSIRVFLSIDG
jgi:hypothetical protein